MKIATISWAARRHVGRLSADGRDVTPLALGDCPQAMGALALVEAMRRRDRVRFDIQRIDTLSNPVE